MYTKSFEYIGYFVSSGALLSVLFDSPWPIATAFWLIKNPASVLYLHCWLLSEPTIYRLPL